MKIRFYNARILTMKNENKIITGELWVEGNRITHICETNSKNNQKNDQKSKQINNQNNFDAPVWDREIDVEGNLLMPGFKNAHTHSGMTFLRSFADDLPLEDWLQDQIFPMEAKITSEDIYHLSKLAILEYLSGGITANFDMYLTPDTIAKASEDCGFRTVITGGLNDFTMSVEELEKYYLKYNQKDNQKDPQKDSMVSFILGFHAEYTNSLENIKGVAKLAEKYHAPVYTHCSETKKEVEACIERFGKTPVAFLADMGIWNYGGGAYHCVHMTDEDLTIFKEKKLHVVTCPGSNVKLASGIAPIRRMQDLGIDIAIGTDGPASNNCLDMFREMFLTTGLAKLKDADASAVDADSVLKMATIGGAGAMGLMECDTLEPGKLADLIMVDLKQPNMQPLNNITKNLVYSGSKTDIKMTMINGIIRYEDGKYYVDEDPEYIYKKANDIVKRIVEQNS